MDIEHLNKTQIILLTLLVSFVTSIATGIATVTLVEQAPPEVIRVVNKVVERTVETIIPSSTTTVIEVPGEKEVITKETTIVVKEEEALSQAIERVGKSLVRVNKIGEGTVPTFTGLGVVLSREGVVLAPNHVALKDRDYLVHFPDGVSITMQVVSEDKTHNIVRLQKKLVVSPQGRRRPEPEPPVIDPLYIPVTFAAADNIKIGQTVVALSGQVRNSVSTGIVASLVTEPGADPNISDTLTGISTTIGNEGYISGAPFFNIFGDVVGFGISTSTPVLLPGYIVEAQN